MAITPYLNAIGTAVPAHEVHRKFVDYAPRLLTSPRDARLFARMAERAAIDRRYSVIAPHPSPERLDRGDLFRPGAFPDTRTRMALYERHAPDLAFAAALDLDADLGEITHLVLASCTGFFAPGLDLQIVERLGRDPDDVDVRSFAGAVVGVALASVDRFDFVIDNQALLADIDAGLAALETGFRFN